MELNAMKLLMQCYLNLELSLNAILNFRKYIRNKNIQYFVSRSRGVMVIHDRIRQQRDF